MKLGSNKFLGSIQVRHLVGFTWKVLTVDFGYVLLTVAIWSESHLRELSIVAC